MLAAEEPARPLVEASWACLRPVLAGCTQTATKASQITLPFRSMPPSRAASLRRRYDCDCSGQTFFQNKTLITQGTVQASYNGICVESKVRALLHQQSGPQTVLSIVPASSLNSESLRTLRGVLRGRSTERFVNFTVGFSNPRTRKVCMNSLLGLLSSSVLKTRCAR